ncbi:MAG: bifunctional acetate--CoA ligase family protein/GNAT family N-acetyltransferase [Amaricoccus sp.]|uniref:bifunctional acetate--CoA ligase family protein/GNAT family N-acetyltransferase n=1 Tax=Amaricoccus sp. TaxID=1872485 RepID=UPI0039E6CD13
MTIRNLDDLLRPPSIAVLGAPSPRGLAILRNLRAGGYARPVVAVEPGAGDVDGIPAVASVAELGIAPGLAVLAGPLGEAPARIAELGAAGWRMALVVTPEEGPDPGLRQAMLDAARPYTLRILGPGSLGIIAPRARLDASLSPIAATEGGIALVSESGSIATALLDWAASHAIGFSAVLSLGGRVDVGLSDCLDLLAGDPHTRAILVYVESITDPRRFLSAARAAARLKPVIALKAGQTPQAAAAAETHTGRLSGADAVIAAALRRAGILRVHGLAELFDAAEIVSRFRPMQRGRVAIVTNSGGAGVLAVDRLVEAGSPLVQPGPATLAGLASALPGGCSPRNPVDLGDDADPGRYLAALDVLAADPGVDVLLAMSCPTGHGQPAAVAQALVGRTERGRIGGKPVLACWMGGATAREARGTLRAGGIATYEAPAAAAAAVGHLTDWGRAQASLLQVPDRRSEEVLAAAPDARAQVAALLASAAAEGRRRLTQAEAGAALAAYGIPVAGSRIVRDAAAAGAVATEMLGAGGRLAVKVLSADLPHRSDVGGVVLDVATGDEAAAAVAGIAARVARHAVGARIEGYELQPMVARPEAVELILGVATDPIFGPVILFGAGGLAVEILRDTAVALPPLDSGLAAELVGRTRVSAQLAGYRGRAPADLASLNGALIALSHLVEDFPCLRAVDVNPLLADAAGVIALDMNVEFDPAELDRRPPNLHLAIRPYPTEWRRSIERPDGVYDLRPIRPADALLYPDFLARVSREDMRLRFLAVRVHFPEEFALRWTQLDYDREMAFVALTPAGELAGVSRVVAAPDHLSGEYSLLVRSDLQGRGIGAALMRLLIDYARADGMERIEGMVLAENRAMQGLVGHLGFTFAPIPDDPGVVMSTLVL